MLRPVLLALVLVLAVGVAPASAADVTFVDGQLKITGAPEESSRLHVRFFPNREATVHDDAGTLRPRLGCVGTLRDVICPPLLALQQCHPCSIRIDLADGNDTLALAGEHQKSQLRRGAVPHRRHCRGEPAPAACRARLAPIPGRRRCSGLRLRRHRDALPRQGHRARDVLGAHATLAAHRPP